MKIRLILMICCLCITLTSITVFAEDPKEELKAVTKEELIGEWVMVKMGSLVTNKTNDDGSPLITYYDLERDKATDQDDLYRKLSPPIEVYESRFKRLFYPDGTGEYQLEKLINGKLGDIDYQTNTWQITNKACLTEKFTWEMVGNKLKINIIGKNTLEKGIYKTFSDKKNIEYEIRWINEKKWNATEKTLLLFIVGEGKYEKVQK